MFKNNLSCATKCNQIISNWLSTNISRFNSPCRYFFVFVLVFLIVFNFSWKQFLINKLNLITNIINNDRHSLMVKTIGFQPIFRGSIPRVDIFLFLILCKQFLINNLYLITNYINKLSNLQIKLNKKHFFISKHLKLALNVASNLAECFSSE